MSVRRARQPAIRDACAASIIGHAQTLEADIAAATALYGARDAGSPRSLALHFQAVPQGGFIFIKATGDCGRGEHILRGAAGSFMAMPRPFGG